MIKIAKGAVAAVLLLVVAVAWMNWQETLWCARYLLTRTSPHKKALTEPLPACPGCNVILISLDTLRADRMGFRGSRRALTPHLDEIANHSVVFQNAFTNAFFTTPSHMTIFTGLFPSTHQVEGNEIKVMRQPRTEGAPHVLDARYLTLAEILKSRGYETFWNGPLHLKFFDFKEGFGRGFDHFAPSPFDRGLEFGHKGPTAFRESSLEPLKSAGGRHPVFLFLHSYITHHPYIWREHENDIAKSAIPYSRDGLLGGFRSILREEPEKMPRVLSVDRLEDPELVTKVVQACTDYENMTPCFKNFSSEDQFWHAIGQFQANLAREEFHGRRLGRTRTSNLQTYREAYDSGVRFVDGEIGEFWQALKNSGALKNTIVIILSDHGEELFENGEPSHSSFYDHTARVPLMIYHPKMDHPMVIDRMISLVDVLPTLLEILQIPSPPQTQGHAPWSAKSEDVFGFALGNDFVREPDWKLIRHYDGYEELFYLPLDPMEHQNLIGYKNPIVALAYRRLVKKRRMWRLEQSL